MDFKQELKKYAKIINEELIKYVRTTACPEGILNASMEYSLMAEGKRLRPILVLKTYQLFKDDYQVAMPYAIAMEMVHNFSLIHDDLPAIDNDDFRRGRLTNHKKFGESTAILAGDALLNNAYMLISKDLLTLNEKKTQAFYEFTNAVDRMIIGEYVDTEFEGKEISKEYLEYMHQNKTGALIKASIRIGAILAGADKESTARLTNYAEKIGLAFQIKDDILSETGDEKVLGKPVGNDRQKGKCTFVTKYGIEKAKEMLAEVTKEAVEQAKFFGDNGEFLKELALYIEYRQK